MSVINEEGSPFVAILAGEEPGAVLARDEVKQFALVKSLHPEGCHSLAGHSL